jgi:hypothetical protein
MDETTRGREGLVAVGVLLAEELTTDQAVAGKLATRKVHHLRIAFVCLNKSTKAGL